MKRFQKSRKYLVIALVLFLTAAVAVSVFSFMQNGHGTQSETAQTIAGPFSEDIMVLEMEIGAADVQILPGDGLQVHTDSPYMMIKEKNGRLIIQEKSHIGSLDSSSLTVYIPENFIFEDVDISAGAGQLTIETLSCRELDLELGTGMVEIRNLYAQKSAEIEGGMGQFILHNGLLHDLNFDIGMGEAEIFAQLQGNSEISAGIGSLVLTIPGSAEDYAIHAEAGIGSISIDGKPFSGDTLDPAEHRIDLEGGISSISLYFEPQ